MRMWAARVSRRFGWVPNSSSMGRDNGPDTTCLRPLSNSDWSRPPRMRCLRLCWHRFDEAWNQGERSSKAGRDTPPPRHCGAMRAPRLCAVRNGNEGRSSRAHRCGDSRAIADDAAARSSRVAAGATALVSHTEVPARLEYRGHRHRRRERRSLGAVDGIRADRLSPDGGKGPVIERGSSAWTRACRLGDG